MPSIRPEIYYLITTITILCFLQGCDSDLKQDDEHPGNNRSSNNSTDTNNATQNNNSDACTGESDGKLCEINQLSCGDVELTDRCDNSRRVMCGSCASSEECIDGICECIGESDQELCALASSICGEVSLTDRCGEERSIECYDCVEFQAVLGTVSDAITGELIGQANMRINTWPPTDGSLDFGETPWPLNYGFNTPDFYVETTAQQQFDANYLIVSEPDTCMASQLESTLNAYEWYRIRIDIPGYVPAIFYRHHWGYKSDCTLSDCDTIEHQGQCHRENFELWPESQPYPLYPDFFVDPRDLYDYEWQCARMPTESQHTHLIGIRPTAASVNAGMGPFHLRGEEQGNGDDDHTHGHVYQRIEWSDGRLDERLIADGAFHFHAPHEHIHWQAFVDMYLVQPSDLCLNPFDRPESCITHEARKISWCLRDDTPFDRELMNLYGGEQHYIDPPGCEGYTQGITQGWKDYYGNHLPGQVIVVGPPEQVDTIGPRWLETIIDPANYLYEITRENNLGRIPVEPPTPSSDLCTPSRVLDCSGDLTFETLEERQCQSYLAYDE